MLPGCQSFLEHPLGANSLCLPLPLGVIALGCNSQGIMADHWELELVGTSPSVVAKAKN
jgi:hypothetical protein